MTALKVLVVVMGVMLVVGFVALIVVAAGRVSHKTPGVSGSQSYTAAPIQIPAGARIEAMSAGPDRLVVAVLLADGSRQLVVIDLATGRQVGSIPVQVAP